MEALLEVEDVEVECVEGGHDEVEAPASSLWRLVTRVMGLPPSPPSSCVSSMAAGELERRGRRLEKGVT